MSRLNYVVYHLHTEDSLLDSCTNYKLYVDRAANLGQTAICFTEHGNIFNWIEKKIYCRSKGIKYLHGIECYLTEQLEPKIRDNYHTILIAKNYEGVKEINKLFDLSTQPDHKYFKPRISFDELFAISNNVIKISACLASPLNKLRESNPHIVEKLIQHYDYLEVQPHVNSEEQKEYNQWLHQMSLKYNKPLIAGTDTHALNKYKAECRSILMLAKEIVFQNEDEFDLTYKSYDELCEMFMQQGSLDKAVYLEAIENTNVMANSVENFELDTSFKYPILYGENDEKVFKQRINTMYKDKIKRGIIKKDPQYKEQLQEEMKVFKKVGMVGFMLFMSELICWCWDNGIPIGFCRGSVGGSTTAYITDIIDVDPIKWHTVFSRFCNEDRKEIGDIDIDVSPTQRDRVYEYIINRFGADKTAFILAIGTISSKGTIDEIGRALANKWNKAHPNNKEENPYSLGRVAKIKSEFEADPEATKEKYPELFYYFDGLLNTAISQSMHPAGIIASPITLPDNYGTFWNDGRRILSVNMEEVHEVSLVKYDILGLKNIEIAKDTCEYIGIPYPKSHEIDWEDTNVWEHITDSPVGIFQFEGDYAFKLLKRYQPHKINDLSLINASLRPSGESYRDDLIAHKKHKNPSPIIDEMLKDNGGFLVFQEDTIRFLKDICGLSGSEADNVRRAIGRKQIDRLQAALPQILSGYCTNSPQPKEIAEQEAKEFLQIISDSSNYQFGYNHSTGYSMIGYLCAYLRYYHPVEFICAYLNNANNDDDIIAGTELAKQFDIPIKSIEFGHSKSKYSPDGKAIYKGLSSVKYMGHDISEKLQTLNKDNCNTFIDFLKQNPCNSRQTEALIILNYFSVFGKSQYLLDVYHIYEEWWDKKIISKDKCNYPHDLMIQYCTETPKQYRIQDSRGLVKALMDRVQNKRVSIPLILKTQSEFLGYIDFVIPKAKDYGYVLDIDTKYSPKISLYCLENGKLLTVKMSKQDFNYYGVQKNMLIKYVLKPKNKSINVNGKWQKTDEIEYWINTCREVV